jgi:putative oxidoreductase
MDIKYLGKLLVVSLFIVAGLYSLIFNFNGYAETIASKGIPFAVIVAFCVLIFKIVAGLVVLISKNKKLVRWCVCGLIIFTILAAILYHNVYQDTSQLFNMMKNVSVIGGLLLVYANEE